MDAPTRQLQLDRPIVFFDLETTGVDVVKDRIVELSLLKVHPDGSEESYHSLVNPLRPIPPATTQLHGISDADVASAPTFKEIAPKVVRFLEQADLGGYNCNRFDLPMLAEELWRSDVVVDLHSRRVIDVQVIYHLKEKRTLSAAYRFYCDKELEEAHTATADTRATYEVLLGQLSKYEDLPDSVPALDAYTTQRRCVDFAGRLLLDEHGRAVIGFGKYKGQLAAEVARTNRGYFEWIMDGDFPQDTKQAFMRILIETEQGKSR